MQCVGFAAVARRDAHVLILGSLPGAESLKQGQYYANKYNSFWRIMGELIGAMPQLPYRTRLASLTKNRIALWDVCASATRIGSLDSNIQHLTVIPNDFTALLNAHQQIKLICFNGQPAERLFSRLVLKNLSPAMAALHREVLPSTSPAYAAMKFEEKLARWRQVIGKQPYT